MKELKANILSTWVLTQADAICFTSNGIVKANGELVMGAGVAKAFKDKFPFLPAYYGTLVKMNGNKILPYEYEKFWICNFPTKHHWKDPSDINLIKRSADELVALADQYGWQNVYLTRPGCGLGGLDWEKQVKPVISPILDDRFTVIWL